MPQVALPTGVNLYYETHGQGEPLVLIPSTGFSAEAWKPSQMPLAESAQLIIHDPRGCGRSIATQQVYTINQMANDVVALLDHLGLKAAHFVGHSMGGRIALELALNFPGRVKSLIMAASGSGQAVRPGPDCIPGLPTGSWYDWWKKVLKRLYAKNTAIPALFSRTTIANNIPIRLSRSSNLSGPPTQSSTSTSI